MQYIKKKKKKFGKTAHLKKEFHKNWEYLLMCRVKNIYIL